VKEGAMVCADRLAARKRKRKPNRARLMKAVDPAEWL
jgi:hypothetical protein